jgi:bacterioferritin-associated ferredoxin
MIVCSCNVISDSQVRGALADGGPALRNTSHIYRNLNCLARCGRCAPTMVQIMKQAPNHPGATRAPTAATR